MYGSGQQKIARCMHGGNSSLVIRGSVYDRAGSTDPVAGRDDYYGTTSIGVGFRVVLYK